MRLLAISDIHNNLVCVRKLRAQEANEFDAVIVAGDIGDEIAAQILAVLESFDCPVLYVYGNWDQGLSYEEHFGHRCVSLHDNVVRVGKLYIAGFSGCPTKWGRNPIARQLYGDVEAKHAALLTRISATTAEAEARSQEINEKFEVELEALAAREGERPARRHREKISQLEAQRSRMLEAIDRDLDRAYSRRDYRKYEDDVRIATRRALTDNRANLLKNVREHGVDPERLIIVAHERLYRLSEDFGPVRTHLYGHRHGFRRSLYQGTDYVNVSVLDRVLCARPKDGQDGRHVTVRNINAGTYTILEIDSSGETQISSKPLNPFSHRWVLGSGTFLGVPWAPDEAAFV